MAFAKKNSNECDPMYFKKGILYVLMLLTIIAKINGHNIAPKKDVDWHIIKETTHIATNVQYKPYIEKPSYFLGKALCILYDRTPNINIGNLAIRQSCRQSSLKYVTTNKTTKIQAISDFVFVNLKTIGKIIYNNNIELINHSFELLLVL